MMGRKSEETKLKEQHLAAKIAAAEARAKKTRLETSIKAGEYVLRRDVELDAAECATRVIAVLSAIPTRLAQVCVGCTAEEIYKLAWQEIQCAVDEIHQSRYTAPPV